jgi:aromatic ring-opening dioxygenase catalytic subunit (LigB family)
LFTYPPDEDHTQLDATIAAMRELGKILDETRPDVVVFLGSDHLETFSINCVPTFAIVTGSRAVAEFAGRRYDLPIHREMAEDFLNKLVRAEFDIAYSEDALLGHTFAVPFEYVLGGRDIPVVPFHTNVYMPPLPSPRRCAALGREVARIIASRPERAALIASGGMSHYPGTWKYPQPEFEFDRWLIGQLEQGNADALLDMTVEQLDEVGNTELLNWAVMFGAIGPQPGELLQYTPTWHHGHAMMRFIPPSGKSEIFQETKDQRPKTKDPGQSESLGSWVLGLGSSESASDFPPQAGSGYQFKNKGFEFYKHPPASAYKLNKILFEVRTNSELRRRLLDDLDGVVAEWEMNAEEKEAMQALASVGRSQKVSDNAAVLVKAGAHPLQALMTLHVVHGEFKKLQNVKRKT